MQALERLTFFLLVIKVGINERIETYAALIKEIETEGYYGEIYELKILKLTNLQKREYITSLDGDIYRKLTKARMRLFLRLEGMVSDGSKKWFSTIYP